MNKTLIALLAVALIPTALGHVPAGAPNPACNATENPHDYVVQSESGAAGYGAGFVLVSDGCPSATTDGDFESGVGGAFLPAGHHGSTVCVTDNVLGSGASFSVGADADGDGLITPGTGGDSLVTGTGCVAAGGAAGADGGWWVFVHQPATAGHVTTL